MLHPATKVQFINPVIGHGVFATSDIPKGTILWVRDDLDQEFTPGQVANMNEVIRETLLTYSYRNNKGNFIFCWDNTRYINHSFDANCMTTPYGFEIAIKDIEAGDEITNDYGTLNIIEPFEPCDEDTGRKIVQPNDIADLYETWDRLILESIKKIDQVEQPLKKYFKTEIWEEVQLIRDGKKSPKSILSCLYIPE